MATRSSSAPRNRILSLLRTMSTSDAAAAAAAVEQAPNPKKAKAETSSGIDRQSVTDVDFDGARVLMRVDFNVPRDKTTGTYRCFQSHQLAACPRVPMLQCTS